MQRHELVSVMQRLSVTCAALIDRHLRNVHMRTRVSLLIECIAFLAPKAAVFGAKKRNGQVLTLPGSYLQAICFFGAKNGRQTTHSSRTVHVRLSSHIYTSTFWRQTRCSRTFGAKITKEPHGTLLIAQLK